MTKNLRFWSKHFQLLEKIQFYVFFFYGSLDGNGAGINGVINGETDGAKQKPSYTLLNIRYFRKSGPLQRNNPGLSQHFFCSGLNLSNQSTGL